MQLQLPGPLKSRFGERANMKMNMSLHPSQIGIPILNALGRKTTVLPGLLNSFMCFLFEPYQVGVK